MDKYEMLDRLHQVSHKAIKSRMVEDKFLAIGVTTSVARGDVWIASDIDIIAIAGEGEGKSHLAEDVEGVWVDWLVYSQEYLNNFLMGYPATFSEKRLPNLLYECEVVFDPQRILESAQRFVKDKRYNTEVTKIRSKYYIDRSKNSLEKAHRAINREELVSGILWLREAAYFAVSAFIEMCHRLPSKRNLIRNIGECSHSLREDRILSLYLSINDLKCLDNKTINRVLIGFNQLVHDASKQTKSSLTNNQDTRETALLEDFLLLCDIYYPRFIQGLEQLINKNMYREVANLAELELRYRIGEALTHACPSIGGDTTRVIYATEISQDFKDNYLHVTRIRKENLEEEVKRKISNVKTLLNIAHKHLDQYSK